MTPFWRREKPLHEQLAERGGLTVPTEATRDVAPWHQSGVHGVARPREFDAVTTVDVEGVPGDDLAFVALDEGTLLLESDHEVDLDPFADALAASVEPPYRAIGIRKGERTWALAAKSIQVAQIDDEIGGDSVELAVGGDERTLLVDGAETFGVFPSLESLARDLSSYVVRADRLDGDLWEVKVVPL